MNKNYFKSGQFDYFKLEQVLFQIGVALLFQNGADLLQIGADLFQIGADLFQIGAVISNRCRTTFWPIARFYEFF